MGIGCPDATGGKLVDVRRRDFGCRVVAGDVAVAQVIREDDNDVWSVRSHVSGVHRMEGGFLCGVGLLVDMYRTSNSTFVESVLIPTERYAPRNV